MAQKAWRATTNIQYGQPGGELTVFEPGDIVEGLTKEQMAQLWEAGALEATVVADSKDVEPAEEKVEAPQVAPPAPKPAATAASTEKSPEGGSTEGSPGA
jgi:hypothetical protein